MKSRKRSLRKGNPRIRRSSDSRFYRAFEDRFRGSRETIRSRLQVYLPFIEPLKVLNDHPAAVDLGCGGGEWLELLTENGFEAQGVDIDDEMLAPCREKGLRVAKQDAVAFLRTLGNETQAIVSGFHIVEHLEFAHLQSLVEEASRVLKPAGLLVLETPNPENFRVSSLSFYYDPTHHHPLPPGLLSFVLEYHGFRRVKVIRLQESRKLANSKTASLQDVLSGGSPDYAVIGQKAAVNSALQSFESAFKEDFGLSTDALVERFDRQILNQTTRVVALETRLDEERNIYGTLDAHVAEEQIARRLLEARIEGESNVRTMLEKTVDAELARTRDAITASESRLKSLEVARDTELARIRELLAANEARAKLLEADLAASEARGKSLEADLLAQSECLAARDAELARIRELMAANEARATSLEADLVARTGMLAALDGELERIKTALTAGDMRTKLLETDLAAKNRAVTEILASRSWRITGPLRGAGRAVRGVRAWATLKSAPRPRRVASLRPMVPPTADSGTPIQTSVQHDDDVDTRVQHNQEVNLSYLSLITREIYLQLKRAVERRKQNA
jgi:O-antigen chain-terminating methyltransferase